MIKLSSGGGNQSVSALFLSDIEMRLRGRAGGGNVSVWFR